MDYCPRPLAPGPRGNISINILRTWVLTETRGQNYIRRKRPENKGRRVKDIRISDGWLKHPGAELVKDAVLLCSNGSFTDSVELISAKFCNLCCTLRLFKSFGVCQLLVLIIPLGLFCPACLHGGAFVCHSVVRSELAERETRLSDVPLILSAAAP